MKCPHCLTEYHSDKSLQYLANDDYCSWTVTHELCPACRRLIIELRGDTIQGTPYSDCTLLVYPRAPARTPPPQEVPDDFAQDYREAYLVLNDSPKASAALSRRCLQLLLREVARVKPGNLSDEIRQVSELGTLPSDLAGAIDAVRTLGNFAAHPTKNTNTGEIVGVEPEEAEWLLDTLEGLFDFYFVRPTKMKEKRDKLNQKLKNAGKPEMR